MGHTTTATIHGPGRGRSARAARDGLRELLVTMLFAAILMASAIVPAALRPPTPLPSETASVKVESGQTLWAIARCYAPQGTSTLETVELLRDLNGLGEDDLVAGTVLRVPRPATESQLASR